jgi:hypothetical protein
LKYSLSVANLGYSAIPKKNIDGLKNKEVLEKYFDDFIEV